MSTNTAALNNFHPRAPKRKLENYADIINCKRPHTKNPLGREARAAQFAPYAALVGHKDIINTEEANANSKNDINHNIIVEYD